MANCARMPTARGRYYHVVRLTGPGGTSPSAAPSIVVDRCAPGRFPKVKPNCDRTIGCWDHTWPDVAKFSPNLAHFGRIWTISAKVSPTLPTFRPRLGPKRPNLDDLWSNLAKFRQTPSKFWPELAHVLLGSANLGLSWPKLARLSKNWANSDPNND